MQSQRSKLALHNADFSPLQWTWADYCFRLCWSSGPEPESTPWTRKRTRWTMVRRLIDWFNYPVNAQTAKCLHRGERHRGMFFPLSCFPRLFIHLASNMNWLQTVPVSAFQAKMSSGLLIMFLFPQWTESKKTGSRKATDISRCHHTHQLSLEKREAEPFLGKLTFRSSVKVMLESQIFPLWCHHVSLEMVAQVQLFFWPALFLRCRLLCRDSGGETESMLLNETVPQWVIDITVDVSISADFFFFF